MSLCPVHMCHPSTGATLEAEGIAGLCRRHQGKLAPAMLQSLLFEQGDPARDAAKLLGECIREARANDGNWSRWAVVNDGRAEPFEKFRDAMLRASSLEGIAQLISGESGLVDWALASAQCPHEARQSAQGVIARGTTLEATRARLANPDLRATLRGRGPVVFKNIWTGEELATVEPGRPGR